MPRKHTPKRMPATLLALHDSGVPETSNQSSANDEQLQQKYFDPSLAIKELEDKIVKNYELSKKRDLIAVGDAYY